MIPRLVVASKNRHKAAEMAAIALDLGLAHEVAGGLDWPEVPETGETLEANAVLKAQAVAEAVGLPALADDTGVEVRALGGRPGVATARFAGPEASPADNVSLLLARMEGASDRSARFRTVVVLLHPGGEPTSAEGVLEGAISTTPRGGGGFGYDPVFEVGSLTLAEMDEEAKNRLSHRRLALEALARAMRLDSARA